MDIDYAIRKEEPTMPTNSSSKEEKDFTNAESDQIALSCCTLKQKYLLVFMDHLESIRMSKPCLRLLMNNLNLPTRP